jgi:Asp-tRNA(Asn)/Glu-tRNA(Gln) amidotransferase A subunit family amidase
VSEPYDLKPWQAPRLAGTSLRLAAWAAEGPLGGLIAAKFLRDVGVERLRAAPVSAPLPAVHPVFSGGEPVATDEPAPMEQMRLEGQPFESAADFTRAYAAGTHTPADVARAALEWSRALDERAPAMRIFIAQQADDVRAQAEASTARWAAGRPLGPLDGVPVAIKDELDVAGYPTTVGTAFQGVRPATHDAFVVARLRAAGAVLLGKANMHEIGIGVTGINPHHGACRNPWNPKHVTGGSSSGSGAAVAAGLCPIALGADGGGSIRIPAALCGVFGLKATYGRISESGAAPLCWSVAHVGPLAATAADLALAYALIAGPDPHDANTLRAPPLGSPATEGRSLRGLRIGVFEPWFRDADADVVRACEAAVDALCARGAVRVRVTLPGLDTARTAHVVSIVSEMYASQLSHLRADATRYAPDVRLSLALASHLRASDYALAQRHRVELHARFVAALTDAEVIATPMVACTAPEIPEAALAHGMSDVALTDRIMRFAAVSNLTGLPAVSCPVGPGANGLPVGLQLIGRAWDETLLLDLARHVETCVPRANAGPAVHRRLLST